VRRSEAEETSDSLQGGPFSIYNPGVKPRAESFNPFGIGTPSPEPTSHLHTAELLKNRYTDVPHPRTTNMSNSGEQTFDEFLRTTDLRSWDRNYMKWYGSIVLKPAGSPDLFSFTLVVYLTDAHEKRSGICHVFEWRQQRQTLCAIKSVHCAEPFHEDNRLRGVDKARNDLLSMQEPTDSVPSLLVETLLDDRFRSEICRNLQDPEQHLGILHWLQDQQFSVYRLLSGPESSRNMFQKALFPLKPDFQKYNQRSEHPSAAPQESRSYEDRFGRKH
jgi:hypothetical protein